MYDLMIKEETLLKRTQRHLVQSREHRVQSVGYNVAHISALIHHQNTQCNDTTDQTIIFKNENECG